MYLHFLADDSYEALVRELTKNILHMLGEDYSLLDAKTTRPLAASIDGGPWIDGAIAKKVGAGSTVLTLGRHPRCDLQMCAATTPYVSRLQSIVVRARGRCVVYDMCSLMGTEATASLDGTPGHHEERCMIAPDARMVAVFPWAPGAELLLRVSHEGKTVSVRLREPPASSDEDAEITIS